MPDGRCSRRAAEMEPYGPKFWRLLLADLVCLLFAGTSIMTTSSRMTFAFARDHGLPFSRFFARVHPRLDVPLEALALTNLVVLVFGCIFLLTVISEEFVLPILQVSQQRLHPTTVATSFNSTPSSPTPSPR